MQREAEIAAWPALANRVTSSHPSIDNRSFEKNAWDVQFTFGGASSEIDTSSEPECECTPLPLPDVSDEPIHARHVGDDAVFDRELEEWRRLLAVQRLARDARSAVSAINKNRDTSDYTPACMSLRGLRSGRVRYFDAYSEATKHEVECPAPRGVSGHGSQLLAPGSSAATPTANASSWVL